MFFPLDSRIKKIFFNIDAPFGSISVIVFGDIRQSGPVCDRWIFSRCRIIHTVLFLDLTYGAPSSFCRCLCLGQSRELKTSETQGLCTSRF